MVNAGADITTHDGWKTSEIDDGYIEDSLSNRIPVDNKIVKYLKQPQASTRESVQKIINGNT